MVYLRHSTAHGDGKTTGADEEWGARVRLSCLE